MPHPTRYCTAPKVREVSLGAQRRPTERLALGEHRPEIVNTWSNFRCERLAKGRPGWKPLPGMG